MKNRVSMYDQLEYYQNILAPKYLDLENLDASRVGLYGYLNEVLADTTGDIVKENAVLFNEIFFKKAQIPESILAYAAQYRIEDINAKPAKMQFCIYIREDMILDNSITDSAGNSYFIIDSDSELFVEDNFKYLLDYDIKINIRKSSKKGYIYSAQYLMNKENKLSDITSPYLKVSKQRVNTSEYLCVIVTARQLSKVTMESKIFSDDILSYISKDFIYDGSLADFNVYYRPDDTTPYRQIEKLIIDSAPVDDDFCYYQYLNENTISISFSTLARHFKPSFNSTLKLEIYTSDGTKGNFSYNGDNVRLNLKSNKYDYKKVLGTAMSLSDSKEGKDRLSYTDLKQLVSYYASTAQNISTTIDLDKYFTRTELSSQSKLTFVKKRDDILDRLFGAYMLMRDQDDSIVPSNTLDLHLNDSSFDQRDDNLKRYVVKAGSSISYIGNTFDVEKKANFVETDKFKYSNPYAIILNKEPLSISYYLNSINKEFLTDFKYINDTAFYQFINNKVKIFRDAINGDDKYVMTFTIVPNLSDIDFDFANLDANGKFVSPNGKLKIFAQYTNHDNDASYYNEAIMIDYDKATKQMTFKIELTTDDYISSTNKLRLTNSVKLMGSDTIIPEVLVEATEMIVSLLIFFKDDQEHSAEHGYENTIIGSAGLQLTNSYLLNEDINLINDMTDIMRSTVIDKLSPSLADGSANPNKYEYIIKNVPLMNYDYIKNRKLAEHYVENVFNNAKNIRESLKLITNNFNIDLKMYNTYGKSKYFYVLGDKTNILNDINITISMDIHMNPASVTDESTQFDIIEFIKNYIEQTNDDNNLYVSNLMNALEEEFNEIKFITFNNINDYSFNVQSVEKNFPTYNIAEKNNMVNFVPEFLNVSKKYSKDSLVADYDLNIKFK